MPGDLSIFDRPGPAETPAALEARCLAAFRISHRPDTWFTNNPRGQDAKDSRPTLQIGYSAYKITLADIQRAVADSNYARDLTVVLGQLQLSGHLKTDPRLLVSIDSMQHHSKRIWKVVAANLPKTIIFSPDGLYRKGQEQAWMSGAADGNYHTQTTRLGPNAANLGPFLAIPATRTQSGEEHVLLFAGNSFEADRWGLWVVLPDEAAPQVVPEKQVEGAGVITTYQVGGWEERTNRWEQKPYRVIGRYARACSFPHDSSKLGPDEAAIKTPINEDMVEIREGFIDSQLVTMEIILTDGVTGTTGDGRGGETAKAFIDAFIRARNDGLPLAQAQDAAKRAALGIIQAKEGAGVAATVLQAKRRKDGNWSLAGINQGTNTAVAYIPRYQRGQVVDYQRIDLQPRASAFRERACLGQNPKLLSASGGKTTTLEIDFLSPLAPAYSIENLPTGTVVMAYTDGCETLKPMPDRTLVHEDIRGREVREKNIIRGYLEGIDLEKMVGESRWGPNGYDDMAMAIAVLP